jgi:hypothetical protein
MVAESLNFLSIEAFYSCLLRSGVKSVIIMMSVKGGFSGGISGKGEGQRRGNWE